MNHQPKTDYSIPLDEFNTRAENLVNKANDNAALAVLANDKLTQIYEKEIKECFKFLDTQYKKYKRKASFQKSLNLQLIHWLY